MHTRALYLALTAVGCALAGAASQAADGACAQPYVYAVNPVCQPLPNGQTQCQTIAMMGPAPGCAAPGSFRLVPVAMTPPVLMPPPMANPYLQAPGYAPQVAYNPSYNPYLQAPAYPAPPMANPYLQAQALPATPQAQPAAPIAPPSNPYLQQQAYQPQAAAPQPAWTFPWQMAPAAQAPVAAVATTPAPAMAQAAAAPASTTAVATPAVVPAPIAKPTAAPIARPIAMPTPAPATAPISPAAPVEIQAAEPGTATSGEEDALAHFAFASARLTEAERAALDAWLARVPRGKPVIVTGHTDRLGTRAYNLKLSKRRAQVVRGYLIAKGMAPGRIRLVAKGESMPVKRCPGKASPATKRCLAPNRRVVLDPK